MTDEITNTEIEELFGNEDAGSQEETPTDDFNLDTETPTETPTETEDTTQGVDIGLLKRHIERYHLGGLIDKAYFDNTENTTNIIGMNDSKSLYASINSRKKLLNIPEFGVFNTKHILSLINLFDESAGIEDESGSSFMLYDNDGVSVEIMLADSSVVNKKSLACPKEEKITTELVFNLTLTKEFIDKIIKAMTASSSEKVFYLMYKRNKPKFVIGEDSPAGNKINIDISEIGTSSKFEGKIAFPIQYLKNVLSSVSNMDKITMKVYAYSGILIIHAIDENYSCKYFLGMDTQYSKV